MAKADRANLERLARKRASLAKSMIGERVKVLRADVEDQLASQYEYSDALWAETNRAAAEALARADEQVAQACRRVGIPDHLRPSLRISWSGRGENALAERRAELRRLAHARIDAAAGSAKVAIEASLLEVETRLIREGLESAQAVAWLDAMPTAEGLLPTLDVATLEAGQAHGQVDDSFARYGGWEPPSDAAAQLLTPPSASDRANKRRQVLEAITAHPDESDRAVSRLAGVDHKTVGKLRAAGGETPQASGETPQGGGAS